MQENKIVKTINELIEIMQDIRFDLIEKSQTVHIQENNLNKMKDIVEDFKNVDIDINAELKLFCTNMECKKRIWENIRKHIKQL